MSKGEKKPEEKKPEEKKPEEMKAQEEKPEEKKAQEKKPQEKEPTAKKADDKKAERKTETPAPKKNETGLPGKRLFVDPTLHVIDALDVETVAIGLCADVRPLAGGAGFIDWRMCGKLSELVRKGTITGKAGEKVLLPTSGMIPATRLLVFGWGPKASLLDNAVARLAWMVDVLTRAGAQRIAVALPEPAGILVGLVEEHLKKPLGDRLSLVFGPDALMTDAKDTRPIPAAPPPTAPAPSTSGG